jgi:hypothetical protein
MREVTTMIDLEIVRALALALPEAEERDHRGRPSFRVRNKIFATLWPDERRVVLKLSPAEQAALTMFDEQSFSPVPGGWGQQGWTNVRLETVGQAELEQALKTAWREVAPKRLVAAYEDA